MIIKTENISAQKQKIPFQVVDNQHALLMPIGDIHWGTPDFPTTKFKKHIQWSLDRGVMFVGMGEYLDFASTSQRTQMLLLRDSTRQELDDMVRAKMDAFAELLQPTVGRWIGLLEGDHRWDFIDGTSADQYLCGLLKCDFLGTSALIRLHPVSAPKKHPEADTFLYVHHGVGTSRRTGGHLNRVEDLLEWIDADIYLMAHSHAKIGAPIDMQYVTPDGVHTHRTKLIARTGSWLKAYSSTPPQPLTAPVRESRGNYVEQKAYTPSALGSPCFGIGWETIPKSRYYKPAIHFSI